MTTSAHQLATNVLPAETTFVAACTNTYTGTWSVLEMGLGLKCLKAVCGHGREGYLAARQIAHELNTTGESVLQTTQGPLFLKA